MLRLLTDAATAHHRADCNRVPSTLGPPACSRHPPMRGLAPAAPGALRGSRRGRHRAHGNRDCAAATLRSAPRSPLPPEIRRPVLPREALINHALAATRLAARSAAPHIWCHGNSHDTRSGEPSPHRQPRFAQSSTNQRFLAAADPVVACLRRRRQGSAAGGAPAGRVELRTEARRGETDLRVSVRSSSMRWRRPGR